MASSTVILGLPDLKFWAAVVFVCVALATFVTSLESFFNWCTRWVAAEEAQEAFYRLQDELEYLVTSRAEDGLAESDVKNVFDKYTAIWNRFSNSWREERRRAGDGSRIS